MLSVSEPVVFDLLMGGCGHVVDHMSMALPGAKRLAPPARCSQNAYFGDRDRSFRLKVTGHFGAT
jgi:hypothetical protein